MAQDASSNQRSLWSYSLSEVVAKLRSGDVTAHDLLSAVQSRIDQVNPAVNALPTLCFERAYRQADELGRRALHDRGTLGGLPVPVKDSICVSDVRTTFGSRAFSDHVPDQSDVVVERLERQGGVIYAKSNTPEFEAGANTFNEVFGATVNPWNTALSAGGSSGGAAAAVATGMAWGAIGTDFACSLRNPAAMCGVVGLRPSPGLIPQGPNNTPYQTLSVIGPIARSVADVALLLDAIAGFDARDPLSFSPDDRFSELSESKSAAMDRIAFSADLGVTPVDPEVACVVRAAVERIAHAGHDVREGHPDMTAAHECFRVLRAYQFAAAWGHLLNGYRKDLKPEVVWNIQQGLDLKSDEIIRADWERARLRREFTNFMTDNDFLITPTSIVAAYPVEQRFVEQCNGQQFENYLQWMAIAYSITLTSFPAISIPCGFTADGRPVGMQIIGPHRGEKKLLAFANYLETLLSVAQETPIDPRTPRFENKNQSAI